MGYVRRLNGADVYECVTQILCALGCCPRQCSAVLLQLIVHHFSLFDVINDSSSSCSHILYIAHLYIALHRKAPNS